MGVRMDKYDFIERLGKSSILAVFEAAQSMLDDDYEPELVEAKEAYDEEECEKNFEGFNILDAFDAFEEDPDEYTSGKKIGIPSNQILVKPMSGMLKPSPLFALFQVRDEDL